MIIKTKEEKDAALELWSELKDKYLATYGKEWNCRFKQGNALDDEIFELFDAIHQYEKVNEPRCW